MRMMAVVNEKGGGAKTTTSVNLAATLAERGRRVLLIDIDPHHSATQWYDLTEGGRGIFDLFAEPAQTRLEGLIVPTGTAGVWLVPSSRWLVGAEKVLATEPGAERVLREKLAELPPGRFDYVLMDCPPTLGVLTVNALTAASEVLVPVECHVMGLQGLSKLMATVERVRKRLNPTLAVTGIVACRLDQRTRHAKEVAEMVRERFPELTYRTVIRENVRLAECPSHGVPITAYAAASTGAEDYRGLAAEVIAQEGRAA
jgi:chromosome partitioning protein